ncbi:MAG: helix-hairpin-helix domain-containing protein [Treponema sp.]|nr:helix-hairpin-helix domain-containing protein [Treponema sp.]
MSKGPEPGRDLFQRFQNTQVDRCALYQYHLAAAYANGTITDYEKLKWWNWKD